MTADGTAQAPGAARRAQLPAPHRRPRDRRRRGDPGLAARGWDVTLLSSALHRRPGVRVEDGIRTVRVRAWNGLESRGVPFPVFSPWLLVGAVAGGPAGGRRARARPPLHLELGRGAVVPGCCGRRTSCTGTWASCTTPRSWSVWCSALVIGTIGRLVAAPGAGRAADRRARRRRRPGLRADPARVEVLGQRRRHRTRSARRTRTTRRTPAGRSGCPRTGRWSCSSAGSCRRRGSTTSRRPRATTTTWSSSAATGRPGWTTRGCTSSAACPPAEMPRVYALRRRHGGGVGRRVPADRAGGDEPRAAAGRQRRPGAALAVDGRAGRGVRRHGGGRRCARPWSGWSGTRRRCGAQGARGPASRPGVVLLGRPPGPAGERSTRGAARTPERHWFPRCEIFKPVRNPF